MGAARGHLEQTTFLNSEDRTLIVNARERVLALIADQQANSPPSAERHKATMENLRGVVDALDQLPIDR